MNKMYNAPITSPKSDNNITRLYTMSLIQRSIPNYWKVASSVLVGKLIDRGDPHLRMSECEEEPQIAVGGMGSA